MSPSGRAHVEAWLGVDDVVDGEEKDGSIFLPIFLLMKAKGFSDTSRTLLVSEGDESRISLVGTLERENLATVVPGSDRIELSPGYM